MYGCFAGFIVITGMNPVLYPTYQLQAAGN